MDFPDHGPWILKLDNSVFCLKLQAPKLTDSFHNASYTKPAIVLFKSKSHAKDFKQNYLSKFSYNNVFINDNSLDDFNEGSNTIEFKLNIDINQNIEFNNNINCKFKNVLFDQLINDDKLSVTMLNSFDNEQLMLFSVFAYAIYIYINDMSIRDNKIEMDTVVLDPFSKRTKDAKQDKIEITKFKNELILKQLELIYKISENIE